MGIEVSNDRFFLRVYFFFVLATLLAGPYFTKWHVVGLLYMHDFLLMLVTIYIVLKPPRFLFFPTVLIVLLISLIYLVISFATQSSKIEFIIRQFALFGYMGCYYLLFMKANGPLHQTKIVNFLIRVGILSTGIQLSYSLFVVVNGRSVFEDYNYFSPAIVLGLIIAAGAILAYIRSWTSRSILFGLSLLLSTTTGHSSAAFSMLAMAGLYMLLLINSRSKLIVIVTGLCGVLMLYLLLPQFHDANASFRLITWYHSLKRIVLENYGLIGKGFGIPYFTHDLILDLYSNLGSTGFFGVDKVNEPYFSSLHNSFLTIFLAIGLLPGLLILYPFFRLFLYMKVRKQAGTNEADFIYLSLTGLTVWSMFNMILELPHSTALYWLTYFSGLSITYKPSHDSGEQFEMGIGPLSA
ncbi:MAG: hypothetical protein JST46_01670 [Bacteroidetes bacterium]|nr:hypothetical protein [Bacteroidota bacterium]